MAATKTIFFGLFIFVAVFGIASAYAQLDEVGVNDENDGAAAPGDAVAAPVSGPSIEPVPNPDESSNQQPAATAAGGALKGSALAGAGVAAIATALFY